VPKVTISPCLALPLLPFVLRQLLA